MYWICAHPGATERDYQDHMRQLIAIYGWAVQGVERDGIHPPWAYTGPDPTLTMASSHGIGPGEPCE